jgi:hypothetical protein
MAERAAYMNEGATKVVEAGALCKVPALAVTTCLTLRVAAYGMPWKTIAQRHREKRRLRKTTSHQFRV